MTLRSLTSALAPRLLAIVRGRPRTYRCDSQPSEQVLRFEKWERTSSDNAAYQDSMQPLRAYENPIARGRGGVDNDQDVFPTSRTTEPWYENHRDAVTRTLYLRNTCEIASLRVSGARVAVYKLMKL